MQEKLEKAMNLLKSYQDKLAQERSIREITGGDVFNSNGADEISRGMGPSPIPVPTPQLPLSMTSPYPQLAIQSQPPVRGFTPSHSQPPPRSHPPTQATLQSHAQSRSYTTLPPQAPVRAKSPIRSARAPSSPHPLHSRALAHSPTPSPSRNPQVPWNPSTHVAPSPARPPVHPNGDFATAALHHEFDHLMGKSLNLYKESQIPTTPPQESLTRTQFYTESQIPTTPPYTADTRTQFHQPNLAHLPATNPPYSQQQVNVPLQIDLQAQNNLIRQQEQLNQQLANLAQRSQTFSHNQHPILEQVQIQEQLQIIQEEIDLLRKKQQLQYLQLQHSQNSPYIQPQQTQPYPYIPPPQNIQQVVPQALPQHQIPLQNQQIPLQTPHSVTSQQSIIPQQPIPSQQLPQQIPSSPPRSPSKSFLSSPAPQQTSQLQFLSQAAPKQTTQNHKLLPFSDELESSVLNNTSISPNYSTDAKQSDSTLTQLRDYKDQLDNYIQKHTQKTETPSTTTRTSFDGKTETEIKEAADQSRQMTRSEESAFHGHGSQVQRIALPDLSGCEPPLARG